MRQQVPYAAIGLPLILVASRVKGLHSLAATQVLAETKNLKLVAARLGHANEMLALRRYGHVLPGADRQAADLLGEVVRRRAPGS